MLSIQEVKKEYPGKYPLNCYTLRLANEVMDDLWKERNAERNMQSEDRSGSCKFASLLARSLFGGVLAGNQQHVFVRRQGRILDLNHKQGDVVRLGDKAYIDDHSLINRDYRDSLDSCLPRVNRWVVEFDQRYRQLVRSREGDSRNQMALFA
jgi:hypothetical protein